MKIYERFSEQIVWFNYQYHVFDKFNKTHMVDFYKNIYTARFFSFHTTWRHSNKAVQQAVPLIATHVNDKALYMILKN